MKRILLVVVFIQLILGCGSNESGVKKSRHLPKIYIGHVDYIMRDYYLKQNKDYYRLKLGDTLSIYSSTNSCCQFCVPLDRMKGLVYSDNKLVIPYPKGCEGCNATVEHRYVSIKKGRYILKKGIIGPMAECRDSLDLEEVVVEIY